MTYGKNSCCSPLLQLQVIQELTSNVANSKKIYHQMNSEIQGLKTRIESLSEEKLRNKLVPDRILYESPIHRLPEVLTVTVYRLNCLVYPFTTQPDFNNSLY